LTKKSPQTSQIRARRSIKITLLGLLENAAFQQLQ
jgi:hypothetical protein